MTDIEALILVQMTSFVMTFVDFVKLIDQMFWIPFVEYYVEQGLI